ncbi:MAG: DMT family transporter, partial [Alphaproteobacteria bacterium]|nr:DMT family transporter [Alphaproteobacteria bacterium]
MTNPSHDPLRGIALMVIAGLVFIVMDSLSKLLVERGIPVIQVVWSRYVCHLAFMLVILGPMNFWVATKTKRWVAQSARGLMMLGSGGFFVLALGFLPLPTSISIGFISPLMVTALSIPFLGERVGIRRWSAVIAGFVGVLLVIRPGMAGFDPAMLIPLLSSLSWAVALILTRLMIGERSETTFFYSSFVGFVIGCLVLPSIWVMPTLGDLGLMLAMGLASALGHFVLIRAFLHGEAGLLAPFQYTQLIWATAAGFVVWGDWPDGLAWVGTAVIVVSGLYVWSRERQLARRS